MKTPPPLYDVNRQIALIWSIEDVQDLRPDLTEEQCFQVLLDVEHHHDCDQGVCWETLRITADLLFPEPDGEPSCA